MFEQPEHDFNQGHKMCLVCTRLGLSKDDEGWMSEQDHQQEEEEKVVVNVPQPRRRREQMASRVPRYETVVEPAPSHNNIPAFAAYSVLEGTAPADRMEQRSPYGLCIYDVTPDANPSRAEQMARLIFERTMDYRRGPDNDEDRVEVVVAPLPTLEAPSAAADRELAEHCMSHLKRERASRLMMGDPAVARSWYLPELLSDRWYTMGILVMSRVTDRWEEGLNWRDGQPEADRFECYTGGEAYNSQFGTCLFVKWQLREGIWREWEAEWEETVTSESQTRVTAYSLEALKSAVLELYGPGVRRFYEHLLPDGILDLELAVARYKGS